nr:vacuolar membrane-associated protein iml1 [Polyrhizophydium stewartii]
MAGARPEAAPAKFGQVASSTIMHAGALEGEGLVLNLWVHYEDFSRHDVVINQAWLPGLQLGDLLEIRPADQKAAAPSAGGGGRGGGDGQPASQEARGGSLKDKLILQISIAQHIATLFGLVARANVIVRKIDKDAIKATHVEISFRDQYIGRSDMWRLKMALTGTSVHCGEKVSTLGVRGQVKDIIVDEVSSRCGYVADTTRYIFRSETAKYFIFIQMSKEMWDFDEDGELFFEKCINGFLPELFSKWKEINTNHVVSIILFSRVLGAGLGGLDLRAGREPVPVSLSCTGEPCRDFYRVVIDRETRSDWSQVLVPLKKEIVRFQQDMRSDMSGTTAKIAPTSEGNILEAINLALNPFDKHYVDRDLMRTGLSIVVVTPGTGYYEVNKKLCRLTWQRMIDNGVGLDLVCLSKPPLYTVPMFQFASYEVGGRGAGHNPVHGFATHMPRNSPSSAGVEIAGGSATMSSGLTTIGTASGPGGGAALATGGIASGPSGLPVISEVESDRRSTHTSNSIGRSDRHYHNDSAYVSKSAGSERRVEIWDPLYNDDDPLSDARLSSFFTIPNWVDCSFWSRSSPSSVVLASASTPAFVSRCRMTELQNTGIDQSNLKISVPYLDLSSSALEIFGVTHGAANDNRDNRLPASIVSELANYDDQVFSRLPDLHIDVRGPLLAEARDPIDSPIEEDRVRLLHPKSKPSTEAIPLLARRGNVEPEPAHGLPEAIMSRSHNDRYGYNYVNPCNPANNVIRMSSQARRWEHIFPRVVSPVRDSNLTNWKSLCTPACLPLTTEFFPSDDELQKLYEDYVDVVEPADDPATSDPSKIESLLIELISHRLSQGFQLVVRTHDGSGKAPAAGRMRTATQENLYQPKFTLPTYQFYDLSLGDLAHRLSLEPSGGKIRIQRYNRRIGYDTENINYSCEIWAKHMTGYTTQKVCFSYPTIGIYKWNYLDNLVAGHENEMTDPLKYWRARFLLIPAESVMPVGGLSGGSSDTLTEEESRIAGLRKFLDVVERARWTPPSEVTPQSKKVKRQIDVLPITDDVSNHVRNEVLKPADSEPSRSPVLTVIAPGAPAAASSAAVGALTTRGALDAGAPDVGEAGYIHGLADVTTALAIEGLLSPAADRMSRSSSLLEIALKMQHPSGPAFKNRRWHFTVFENVCVGTEFVDWLLRTFADIDSRDDAIEFGNYLLDKGVLVHVYQRHRFMDGFYFYAIGKEFGIDVLRERLASQARRNPRTPGGPSSSNTALGSSPQPSAVLSLGSAQPASAKAGVSALAPGAPPEKFMLTKQMQIDMDPLRKSTRPERAVLHYDTTHNTRNCYHIRLHWLVCTPRLIEDMLESWARAAEKYSLKLVEAPVDQAQLFSDDNPFQSVVPIPLAVRPPRIPELRERLRAEVDVTPFWFESELLRSQSFVLDLEADHLFPENSVGHSHQRSPFHRTQFVHRSGVAFVQICDDGRFLWVDNRVFLSSNKGSASQRTASQRTAAATPSADPLREELQRLPREGPAEVAENGRIRTVPHIEGNWATFVFVPRGGPHAEADGDALRLHVSLSRTSYLKVFQIERFMDLVEKEIAQLAGGMFTVSFGGVSEYTNDDRTRAFVALDVAHGADQLADLVKAVDSALAAFGKPTFYEGGGAEAGLDSVSDVSSFSKNAKSQPPPRVKATKLSSLIASNRAMLRPIYLTFKQPDLENEYGKYFVKYNLARWQRSVTMLFCLLSILYLYLTIQYSLDSTFFQNNYARKTYTTLPAGFAVCNPDMICTTYSIGFDIAFWIVAVFLPYVLGILASYHLTNSYFTEYNDLISSIVLAFMAFLGVGIRYYVVEQAASLIQPTLIMNLILLLAIYNLRIRFIYTVVTVWWIVILWIIINIPPLFTQQSPTHATGRTYAITFVTHIVTGVVLSLVAYETEYFHRMQFLMSKEMKKNNAKLTNQLKLLAKSYNKKAGSLDSPLERSVMVIRSVMADPVLSSQHLMALGQVLALLSSSNLLTPDLEGTLGDSLDNEQEVRNFA